MKFIKAKKNTKIKLKKNNIIMCALHRPGHFEGVLAVINQFLQKFKPKNIFFGEKDYQQLYLIKKFIRKIYKINVFSCSTVRDKNNVALSSRNILLNKNDMYKSSIIASSMLKFKNKIKKNIIYTKNLNNIENKINSLKNIKIEYLEIRNKINFTRKFTKSNFKIFISFYINGVRLIDNF